MKSCEVRKFKNIVLQLVCDKIVNCKYALPGTDDLAKNVVAALGSKNAVMIPNHGTVCCGADWDMVMKVCFVVEKAAQVYVMAKSIGTPLLISDEDILAMQNFAKYHYGQGKNHHKSDLWCQAPRIVPVRCL